MWEARCPWPCRSRTKGRSVRGSDFGLLETELYQRRWRVLVMTAIGTFMTPLDSSIVSVALPAIGPHLHLSYTEALWVQAAYLLVISILLIPVGRLADMHGPLRFYMMGTILFGLASIGAALSFNGSSLIVARSIQGAGGALMFSTSAAILTSVFPGKERGRVLGLNVMVAYLGLTLGPPIGGLIVSHTSWRWIFLLNVPVALLTLLVGWNLLPAERRDRAALIARRGRLAGPSPDRPGGSSNPGSNARMLLPPTDLLALLGLGKRACRGAFRGCCRAVRSVRRLRTPGGRAHIGPEPREAEPDVRGSQHCRPS